MVAAVGSGEVPFMTELLDDRLEAAPDLSANDAAWAAPRTSTSVNIARAVHP